MAYNKTKDIIDRARLFHQHISELYERLEKVDQKEHVKMLLDYMSRHEKHLAECLEEYEEEMSEKILDTWYKYTPNNKSCEHLENYELKSDMTIDDLVSLAIHLDECLVKLYRDVAENAESDEVRALFASLLKKEEHEEIQLMKNALYLK